MMSDVAKKKNGDVCGVVPQPTKTSRVSAVVLPKNGKQARMGDLLSGKAESDNEFVQYALGKMHECLAEKELLVKQLKKAEEAIELINITIVEVGAEFKKYGDDVTHFDPVLQELGKGE